MRASLSDYCMDTANLGLVPRVFVGELCRDRPSSTELRQSVPTKIDDKVGNKSFGTDSNYLLAVVRSFNQLMSRGAW